MGRLGVVLEHSPLSDKIYVLLRDKIVRLQFSPGERLEIAELAEELGVSRTSVKAAVDRLALEGMVTIAPRHGTFVARLSADDMAEVHAARLMVELFSVENGLANITESELRNLQELESRMEAIRELESPPDADVETYYAVNWEFHTCLVRLARNKRIDSVYAGLSILNRWTWAFYSGVPFGRFPDTSRHEAILDACIRRDVADAMRAIRYHAETSSRKVIESLGSTIG